MSNPHRGDVDITIDGTVLTMRLTLGALAELEDHLQEDNLLALVERFEKGAFKAKDIMALLYAGLKGGGWIGTRADLQTADIEGGPVVAARLSAQLLARAFGQG